MLWIKRSSPSLRISKLNRSERIGRSLHRVPDTRAVSFVDKSAGDVWYVRQVDVDTPIDDRAGRTGARRLVEGVGAVKIRTFKRNEEIARLERTGIDADAVRHAA